MNGNFTKPVLRLNVSAGSNVPSQKSLTERIREIRAEANAFIDARAEQLAKESPGVPVGVLRNLITSRAGGCECRQYLAEAREQD